ncbi:unnamed protein product [Cercospora beticola]|nr:unnamed protein product [Cercospora beticola]
MALTTLLVTSNGVTSTIAITSVPSSSSETTNTGAIAGGTVGGVAGLVFLALAIWFFIARRTKSKKTREFASSHAANELPAAKRPSEEKPALGDFHEVDGREVPAEVAGVPERVELDAGFRER